MRDGQGPDHHAFSFPLQYIITTPFKFITLPRKKNSSSYGSQTKDYACLAQLS